MFRLGKSNKFEDIANGEQPNGYRQPIQRVRHQWEIDEFHATTATPPGAYVVFVALWPERIRRDAGPRTSRCPAVPITTHMIAIIRTIETKFGMFHEIKFSDFIDYRPSPRHDATLDHNVFVSEHRVKSLDGN